MPETMQPNQTDPNAAEAQKIVQEDTDDVLNEDEIARIVLLYLGRETTPEESQRFLNMKESELQVLIGYLNDRREEEKMNLNENKVKQELALKGMKAEGENNIAAMKNGGMPPLPAPRMPMMPQGQPTPSAPAQPAGPKLVRDGRYSLASFS